jgi:hypothetical protein
MSQAIAAMRPRWARAPGFDALVLPIAVAGFVFLVGTAVQDPSRLRLAVAAVAVVLLVGLATHSPVASLLTLMVWLVALGMTRRLVSEVAPITSTDPALLVSPAVLGLLAAVAARRGALRNRTALSNGVLALSLLMLLGAVNPLQGSLFGGFGGLLFVLVPMIAFWIGRGFCDDRTLALLLKLVAVLGVGAAIYGLIQVSSGFPAWDQHWINDASYAALNVNGVIRPFATFNSASEYATFLGLSIVIWLSIGRRPYVLPLTVGALCLLVPAVVLESSRGVIVAVIVTSGLLIGAGRGLRLAVSATVGLLLLVALVFGLRHYGPTSYGTGTSGALVSHQVQGLADPLNPQTSTAGDHLSLVVNGVKEAFLHPAGRGVAVVTIAGAKFGGLTAGTEADPSNVAVALGLPGLLAYAVVFVAGMARVYRIARRRRDGLALAALGVVTVTAFEWLNGGQYAVAVLPWLVLGWADRPRTDSNAALET